MIIRITEPDQKISIVIPFLLTIVIESTSCFAVSVLGTPCFAHFSDSTALTKDASISKLSSWFGADSVVPHDWTEELIVKTSMLFCALQPPGGIVELVRCYCVYCAHVCDFFKKNLLLFCRRRDGKSLERFLEDYFADHLKKYIKSEPVPETNDGPVKVVYTELLHIWLLMFCCSWFNLKCFGFQSSH